MNRRILIVDDDAMYLHLVMSIMKHEGVRAVCAMSSEEAIGALKEFPFTTMITDLNMPGMDGLELAMIARELHPGIHIVMITGEISPDVSRLAAQAGISRVLAKPCTAAQLRGIVREDGSSPPGEPD